VSALSSEQFIFALRRFIARMGKPSSMISDNAPAFKVVSSMTDAKKFMSKHGIQWRFITEFAPWMGGVYERMVGIVKSSLRRTIGRTKLSYDQLVTLLSEAQDVVNSRPLTYVSEDIDDEVITPNHFLRGFNRQALEIVDEDDGDPDFIDKEVTATKIVKMWKKGQRLLQHFWEIWRKDYLTSLREKTTWHHKQKRGSIRRLPQVGEVVLVDGTPKSRSKWQIARINELIESHDGQVRSAKVLIPSGKIVARPLNLLYPLEVDPQDQSESNQQRSVTANQLSVPSVGCGRQEQPTAGVNQPPVPSVDCARQEQSTAGKSIPHLSPLPPATEEPAEVSPNPTNEERSRREAEIKNKDSNTKNVNSNSNSLPQTDTSSRKNNINVDQCRSTQTLTQCKTKRPIRQAGLNARKAWLEYVSDEEE
jgi:hypothetical protein